MRLFLSLHRTSTGILFHISKPWKDYKRHTREWILVFDGASISHVFWGGCFELKHCVSWASVCLYIIQDVFGHWLVIVLHATRTVVLWSSCGIWKWAAGSDSSSASKSTTPWIIHTEVVSWEWRLCSNLSGRFQCSHSIDSRSNTHTPHFNWALTLSFAEHFTMGEEEGGWV